MARFAGAREPGGPQELFIVGVVRRPHIVHVLNTSSRKHAARAVCRSEQDVVNMLYTGILFKLF